ncbi:MAG: hypothetical protein HC845_04750 [Akkermansiaceae bacterium]|nr:hypothetical protein [Akkermansiaceae bacterium]
MKDRSKHTAKILKISASTALIAAIILSYKISNQPEEKAAPKVEIRKKSSVARKVAEVPAPVGSAVEQLPAEEAAESPPSDLASISPTNGGFQKGSYFNYSCACCGDHLQYVKILTKEGLTWPRIQEGITDGTAVHNLQVREEEAILLIPINPHKAVAIMKAYIEHELTNLATRVARANWDTSRESIKAGDLVSFNTLLAKVPNKSFLPMVHESLEYVSHSYSHIDAIVRAAKGRDIYDRVVVYATLADSRLIGKGPALAELQKFIGSGPDEPDSGYASAVYSILLSRSPEKATVY